MCGRFYLQETYSPADWAKVHYLCEGRAAVSEFKWGFPHPESGKVIFNARSETVNARRIFADSMQKRRCVVEAAGFFEWDSAKNKYQFFRRDKKTMYMAGIFQYFENEPCFVILTTGANESIRDVHDRMPLILEAEQVSGWLEDPDAASRLLRQIPPILERTSDYIQQTLFFE